METSPLSDSAVEQLFETLFTDQEGDTFKVADQLAMCTQPWVREKLLTLLSDERYDIQYLAARAISKMPSRQEVLPQVFEAIHSHQNQGRNGAIVEILEEFDLSDHFVDILRLYLFGGFKVLQIAKELLDFTEFDITPRVIKKAEKHWKHYQNNSPRNDEYEMKRREVEQIFTDLKAMFSEGEME